MIISAVTSAYVPVCFLAREQLPDDRWRFQEVTRPGQEIIKPKESVCRAVSVGHGDEFSMEAASE